MQDPRSYHEAESARWESALSKSGRRETRISRLRLLTAVIAILGIFLAIGRPERLYWALPAAAAAAFIALVREALRQERATALIRARLKISNDELRALSGDISVFPAGTGYLDVSHAFSFDLDIFGPRSVYQMLCRCVTLEGAGLLAAKLRGPDLDPALIRARQEAIRELAQHPEPGAAFRAWGTLTAETGDELRQLREWLDAEDEFRNRRLIRIAAAVMPVLAAGCVLLSLWQERMHPALNLVIALNGLLWAGFLKSIKQNNRLLGRNATVVAKYTALLEVPAAAGFRAELLQRIASVAAGSLEQLRIFSKLVSRFDSRNNGMAGAVMNVLFLHDFRCLLQLEAWRSRNRSLLQECLEDLAAFDLLNALGGYAFNHPTYNYPTVDDKARKIEAAHLRHPLLAAATAVGNTFTLGGSEQLYLLTGANMTGKSTFIRTVGVNLVLGQLGLPLPAASVTLPLIRLYTSIRVSDSIQEDVSYFRAELERIRALFDAVHNGAGRYLVLIDEPLRGTNSGDKQQGTQAIIRRLLNEGVTGIVATHDTGLCSLEAQYRGALRNYHFESRVAGDGSLHFDFRLKPGPSTSANASLLMRQMGIIQ